MLSFSIAHFSFAVTTDSNISRVDAHSFSQQTCMELFIGGLSESCKDKFRHEDGQFRDLADWQGIKCNRDKEVYAIQWKSYELEGNIAWQWIPETVTFLTVSKNYLSGTIDFVSIPDETHSIYLGNNKFTGTLNLVRLPSALVLLYATGNNLGGSLELAFLPRGLQQLDLGENDFTGTINLSQLPRRLSYIVFTSNRITGTIELFNLSPSLEYIGLDKNEISSVIVSQTLGDVDIDLTGNKISAVLDKDGKECEFKEIRL